MKAGFALYNRLMAKCKDVIDTQRSSARESRVDICLYTGHIVHCTQHELETNGGMLEDQTDHPTFNIRVEDEYGNSARRLPITPQGQDHETGLSPRKIVERVRRYSDYVNECLLGGRAARLSWREQELAGPRRRV